MRLIVLSVLAAAVFAGCGKKSEAPSSASSIIASDIAAASPLDKSFRLKGAEQLDIDRLFALLPPYLRPTYEKASFEPKSGATVVTGLRFGDVLAGEGFTAKRAEFYGVDLEKIEKLSVDADAPLDAPMELVLAKLRMFDISNAASKNARGVVSIGAVEIDNLRLRQGGIPKTPSASGLAAFFNAFDVAGVYFKNVRTARGASDSASNAAEIDFEAADFRIVGVGGGRMKSLLGRDLDYLVQQSPESIDAASRGLGPLASVLLNGPLRNILAPENQRTKVKTLEWRDVSFAGLMARGLKGERPPVSDRALINLGTVRATDVETFIGTKRFSIVPETIISAMEFSWLAPSKVRAVTRGGAYDFTAYLAKDEKEAIDVLKAHGLDRVKGDSDFAYDWSPDRGGATMAANFESAGFADFTATLALEGLDLKKIEAARLAGATQPVAELAKFKSFSLTIADEEMLNAFYELSALQSGGDAKDIRAATPALMRLGKVELKRDNPRMASYVDALADFLEEGGTLEIRAAPDAPVPLEAISAAAIGGPDSIAAAIDLTVVRKK